MYFHPLRCPEVLDQHTSTKPHRATLHGHGPFPQKASGPPSGRSGPCPRTKPHPSVNPLTGMARSHKKQAGHLPVGAGHAREQSHTPTRDPSRAWPVPPQGRRAARRRGPAMPANNATPHRGTVHGHGPFPQKASGLPSGRSGPCPRTKPHPSVNPFTGTARSHKKQAGHLPVEAGHAREQGHTPTRTPSRPGPVPPKRKRPTRREEARTRADTPPPERDHLTG